MSNNKTVGVHYTWQNTVYVGHVFLSSLSLLIGAFNPFTFKVIIDKFLVIAIFSLCTCVPLPLSSSLSLFVFLSLFLKQSL